MVEAKAQKIKDFPWKTSVFKAFWILMVLDIFGHTLGAVLHLFIASVTSQIPDKGQVTVRYYGLSANAHRETLRKAVVSPLTLRMSEEELKPVPSKGWAVMIRKVYEVDPMVCSRCGVTMKVIAFLTDFSVADCVIHHLKLTFVAEKPPPPRVFEQVALMAAEQGAEYLENEWF